MLALSLGLGACTLAEPVPAGLDFTLQANTLTLSDRGVVLQPTLQPLLLRFSRPLSPRSVNRQAVILSTGGVRLSLRLRTLPVEASVIVTPEPSEVRQDVEYVLTVSDQLRSWDGISLANPQMFRIRFVPGGGASPPMVSLRGEVMPVLLRACGASACHGGTEPVMGLSLDRAEGILSTAVGVASRQHESPTGSQERSDPQWAGLLRVVPFEPEQSYLLYKLLGQGPIRGAAMPRGAARLTGPELDLVQRWVLEGAQDN
ncbi:MAG: hypothetical protein Q8Q09_20785 [Deltaproteobacteria bacterium]|nr:hypothetical protein [Deltaproteobacteria bacterium]